MGAVVQFYCFLNIDSRLRVDGQRHVPIGFYTGKDKMPIYRGLGATQSRSGRVRKTSPPPQFGLRTVQLVTSRYSNYAVRPTRMILYF